MVAHSIHSLTLEDIRYFFKEDATEDNGIPTGKLSLNSLDEVGGSHEEICKHQWMVWSYVSNSYKADHK